MQGILTEYRQLLSGIDDWFAGCIEHSREQVACRPGCSAWYTLNFVDSSPLQRTELRYPFRDAFAREFELLGMFARQLTGQRQLELDTFIPSGLLINFSANF